MKKDNKKIEREAPNDEWFWKNRDVIKNLHPEAIIEEPEHLKRKRLNKENTNGKERQSNNKPEK